MFQRMKKPSETSQHLEILEIEQDRRVSSAFCWVIRRAAKDTGHVIGETQQLCDDRAAASDQRQERLAGDVVFVQEL